MSMPVYHRHNLPEGDWHEYRKVATTSMLRMRGPFAVETSESAGDPLVCEDGYLAVDARGYPYPLDATEHEHIYVPAE